MTTDTPTAADVDPTLGPFIEAVDSAEGWAKTAAKGFPAGDRAVALANVYARLAQAHAANRIATYLADITSMVAELCLRLDATTDGDGPALVARCPCGCPVEGDMCACNEVCPCDPCPFCNAPAGGGARRSP